MLGLSLKHKERHMMTKTIGGLSDVTTDLQIVCNDGLVRTQQAVLSWSSGFLRRLFTSQFLLEDGSDDVVGLHLGIESLVDVLGSAGPVKLLEVDTLGAHS